MTILCYCLRQSCVCVCVRTHMHAQSLSHVQLFTNPWTAACQAPRSMEFSRQGYWSGLPFPPLGNLLDPGIKPMSPVSLALAGRFFTTEPPGKLLVRYHYNAFQFSSVAQSCPTLLNPMDCRTSGLPVHQQLPEFTQTHVHWVGDAIQPSPPL